MTNAHKTRIRIAALALGAAAFLVPVSSASHEDSTLTVKPACASVQCCPEIGSFCDDEGEWVPNYYRATPIGCRHSDN